MKQANLCKKLKSNEKQNKMKDKNCFEKFWNIVGNIGKLVSMFGWISILIVSLNYFKNQKIENAEKECADAKTIFEAAYSPNDFEIAFKKFQRVKKLRPDNLTGFNLFFNKAEAISEDIRKENNGYLVYDSISTPSVLLLLHYADSLNDTKPNKAITLIEYLNAIK